MSFSYLSIDCNQCGKTIHGTDHLRGGMCLKCNHEHDKKVAEVQAEHKCKNEEKLKSEQSVSGSAYPDNENDHNDYWEEINEQERERKTCMYCGEVSNSTDDGVCYPCYRQHCR